MAKKRVDKKKVKKVRTSRKAVKKVVSVKQKPKRVKTSKKVVKKVVSAKKKPKNPLAPVKLIKEKDIAMDFATKVQKKFDRIVKASVLFGSQVKKGMTTVGSDIDIILIVDDAAIEWDLELVAWYREELARLISVQNYAKELHINTVKLSTWWEDLTHGDPVVINILRYGEVLIDYGGFFNPLKALLLKGKIKSTPEAVYAALQRAPGHLARSVASEMGAIEGVYWSMVDSAQAALITAGKMPPSPEHIQRMLKEAFVDSGMLKMKYVNGFEELYVLHKSISRNQLENIKGAEIDEWQDLAEDFLGEMTRIIDTLLEGKK